MNGVRDDIDQLVSNQPVADNIISNIELQ